MKKHDITTIIGLVLGFACVLWGCVGDKGFGSLIAYYDMPSIILTLGGSFCAMMVNYSSNDFKKIFIVIKQTFTIKIKSGMEVIQQFIELSKRARREGLLSLEDEIENIDDDFLKKGLQMVVDGIEPETIRDIMELEIGELEQRHGIGVEMLKAWGGYAPAYGMIGTLIGLIQMLANVTDAASITAGMAKAIITTFYGSVLANLIFNPMASKLSRKTLLEVSTREMMLEGILAIQSGVNPRIVEDKLICYLTPGERLEFSKVNKDQQEVTGNV